MSDCPDLLARLDLAVETDDVLVVTDFKTARSRRSAGDVNAGERQLVLYHEPVQQLTDKPIGLQFAVITKTKQPDIDIQPVTPDPLRIERIRQLIRRVWTGIQSGNFSPVPNSMTCPS